MDTAHQNQIIRHYTGLYGFAMTLSRNEDEARDLVQETVAKALGAERVPQDATAYRVWLFRILHNVWRDRIKRHDRRMAAPIDTLDCAVRSDEWLILHEERINALAVRAAFSKLSRAHQQIIALIDIAGLKYAEAGNVLQVPTGTIMSRLARARHSLLVAMNEANVIPITPSSRRSKP